MNKGALAQALDMVGNAPRNSRVVHALRDIVDMTSDPRGPSFTSVGDMKIHLRSTAGDIRISNNGLHAYVPANMTKREQVRKAK